MIWGLPGREVAASRFGSASAKDCIEAKSPTPVTWPFALGGVNGAVSYEAQVACPKDFAPLFSFLMVNPLSLDVLPASLAPGLP